LQTIGTRKKLTDWGVDAAHWGVEPEKEKKQREKRDCVYIELNGATHIIIGNKLYTAGDAIDATELTAYLQ
jgi:hypothetical protein